MNIENFLPIEHVLFTETNEKQSVIKEIINKLEELKKIDNANRYYAQIMHRESLDNTGVGKGLAIPHMRTETVKDLISFFAISKEEIDYHSYDNIPVRYILLNIVPTEQSTKYLYLVGMISSMFLDEKMRKALNEAKTKIEVYEELKKNAELYFTNISKKNIIEMDAVDSLSEIPSYNLDLLIRLDRLYQIVERGESSEIIIKKIEELKKLIDTKSLAYYEKMKKRSLNPFAILDKKSCTGCHMDLAPVYITQIKESDKIAICNYCGRFLMRI